MKKAVIGLLMVLALFGTCGCGGNKQVDVPIDIRSAGHIGSLHIELTFDPAVLQAKDVKTGKLVEKANIVSSLNNSGRVIIGIIDANGINGDGTVVTVSFDVIGKGTSTLGLENIEAYDATTLLDHATLADAGSFAAESSAVTSPVITFQGQ
jgi:hypothetical protein